MNSLTTMSQSNTFETKQRRLPLVQITVKRAKMSDAIPTIMRIYLQITDRGMRTVYKSSSEFLKKAREYSGRKHVSIATKINFPEAGLTFTPKEWFRINHQVTGLEVSSPSGSSCLAGLSLSLRCPKKRMPRWSGIFLWRLQMSFYSCYASHHEMISGQIGLDRKSDKSQ